MTENRSPRFFYGYVVALVSFLIKVVMWGVTYSFGVFLKPLSAEFGWSRASISGAYSLFMILHGFLCIVAGGLNDRFGPRKVMTVCGFFMGLGYLLMSQISAIWQLYLFYGVIIAIGFSGSFVPLISTVARWFVKRRGLMTGFVVSGVGVGTMIMPLMANWLITNYGWRTSYIVIGSIVLVLIMLAAQFLRRDPAQMGQLAYGEGEVKEEGLDLQGGGFSLREAIHTMQFWMVGAVFVCFDFCLESAIVHIAPHATGLGISSAIAATFLATIGGGGTVGRIMMGGAGDRIGNRLAAAVCFILMSAALFWLLGAREVWMLYLFAAVFGFAYGGFAALQSPIVAELFGMSSLGMILGSVIFIGTIGDAIGPVLTGGIFDITGSYHQAFLICAIVAIIGFILTFFLRPIVAK